ncbi:hypothetical protein Pcinc_027153 [Petrolisthes cinctipes]|uniref:Uncharacterized protein n=1 Tax=Petrolisthes cinctipes TaxID=88211 RepID=A0AAE1K912_PETCI|nr:hypothetical protein Pcinc_027153 [Petrolisthes cinctipes]
MLAPGHTSGPLTPPYLFSPFTTSSLLSPPLLSFPHLFSPFPTSSLPSPTLTLPPYFFSPFPNPHPPFPNPHPPIPNPFPPSPFSLSNPSPSLFFPSLRTPSIPPLPLTPVRRPP